MPLIPDCCGFDEAINSVLFFIWCHFLSLILCSSFIYHSKDCRRLLVFVNSRVCASCSFSWLCVGSDFWKKVAISKLEDSEVNIWSHTRPELITDTDISLEESVKGKLSNFLLISFCSKPIGSTLCVFVEVGRVVFVFCPSSPHLNVCILRVDRR